MTLAFGALAAAGCGGGSNHRAEAPPPSVRDVCKAHGIHYLGKPVRGRATVCLTLTRDGSAVRELGLGLEVAETQCGLRHTEHWHADFNDPAARKLAKVGPGGRIRLSFVAPLDPGHEPLQTMIRGRVRGPSASGTVADTRSCFPRLRWTARRVGSG